MTHHPLVSVVMPAYNSGPYIEEALASAMGQTWSDFELLITDDGSTDQTVAIVESVAARDHRVRLVGRSPHAGPAVARNICLTHARGEFVALLDSDDVWKERYLEEQLGLLTRHPHVSIVTANAVNLNGSMDGRTIWPETAGAVELQPGDLLARENAVCIMSVFRRGIVDRVGGFDARFTANEDYEFWLRAVDAGFIVMQNLRPLGFYRRRPDSVSSDDVRMLKGIIAVLEEALNLRGALAREQPLIQRRLTEFRQELVKARMRCCLQACPPLLDWAYSLRRTLRLWA